MKVKMFSMIVGSITIMLLIMGVARAIPSQLPLPRVAIEAAVSSGISYQGWLTDPNGKPLNGSYTMRFIVYDDEVAGSALWDSGNLNRVVETGLFNVKLGVDQAAFNGQALW